MDAHGIYTPKCKIIYLFKIVNYKRLKKKHFLTFNGIIKNQYALHIQRFLI